MDPKKSNQLKPDARFLTQEETDEIAKTLVDTFEPIVVRQEVDPPLIGQGFPLISYALFDEPYILPDGVKAFGSFKFRGAFATEAEALNYAKKLIQTIDSKFPIHIGVQGKWIPISNSKIVTKEKEYVSSNENDEKTLAKIGLNAKRNEQVEKEQAELLRDIKERERDLRERDLSKDQDSLHAFCTQMQVQIYLDEEIIKLQEKIESFSRKRTHVRKIVHKILLDHGEYKETWLDYFNKVRGEVGVPEFVPRANHFDGLWKECETFKLDNVTLKSLYDDRDF